MALDLDNLPFVDVPLPSNGLVYPTYTNEEGIETVMEKISLRPMTAKDENILHSPALLRTGKAIPNVIQNCIVNPKGIKVDSLLLGDNAALMLFLRMISYGPEIEADNVECSVCEQKFSHNFSLGNLEEKKLPVAPIIPHTNEFEYKLLSGPVVHFRLMTVKLSDDLDNLLKIKRKKNLPEDPITTRLKHQLISLDGDPDLSKLATFIDNMSARDSADLRGYIDSIEPDITPREDVVCPNCAEINNMVVPLGPTFFWPERGKRH